VASEGVQTQLPITSRRHLIINHIGALGCEQRWTIIWVRAQIRTDPAELGLIKIRPARSQRLLHQLPGLRIGQIPARTFRLSHQGVECHGLGIGSILGSSGRYRRRALPTDELNGQPWQDLDWIEPSQLYDRIGAMTTGAQPQTPNSPRVCTGVD